MTAPVLIDHRGRPMTAAVSASPRGRSTGRKALGGGYGSRAFQSAGFDHPSLERWSPYLHHGASAFSQDRRTIQARINDLVRNDGWASAGVTRYVNEVLGAGWRLSIKPNYRALGISHEAATDFADQAEALWHEYASSGHVFADRERTLDVTGICTTALRHWVKDGEACGLLAERMDNQQTFTCVQVISPDRLSNPQNAPDTANMRNGVEIDEHGAPIAYHVRKAHPGDVAALTKQYVWDRIPRWTSKGRARFLHAFQQQEAGDRRGISRFTSIVRKHRQVHQYDDTELQAALVNAVMAAFITSPHDPEAALDDVGASSIDRAAEREVWRDDNPIDMDHVRIAALYDGEDLKTVQPQHPNANFEAFVRVALRNMASALGLTYEQFTMDWSNVNYSSARAALLTIYRAFDADRRSFAGQFMMPWLHAFLEEKIAFNMLTTPAGAPSFAERPFAWANAVWIGPGRGWVDPQKEATASVMRIQNGLSTREEEAALQGVDWREIADQQAREQQHRRELGLEDQVLPSGAYAPAPDETATQGIAN